MIYNALETVVCINLNYFPGYFGSKQKLKKVNRKVQEEPQAEVATIP